MIGDSHLSFMYYALIGSAVRNAVVSVVTNELPMLKYAGKQVATAIIAQGLAGQLAKDLISVRVLNYHRFFAIFLAVVTVGFAVLLTCIALAIRLRTSSSRLHEK
ncbi:MAG: hypothetical protein LBB38_01255, partial [Puniceicoccales bacterium]|nr:hypothetical protein [Puniceicoccales bacterium]